MARVLNWGLLEGSNPTSVPTYESENLGRLVGLLAMNGEILDGSIQTIREESLEDADHKPWVTYRPDP